MDASAERAGTRARVILLVDGRIATRVPLAEGLRASRFQVVEAASSDEALTLLNSNLDVDVLVARDALGGSMDGLALADWVRRTRPALGVFVIPADDDADTVIALLPPSTTSA